MEILPATREIAEAMQGLDEKYVTDAITKALGMESRFTPHILVITDMRSPKQGILLGYERGVERYCTWYFSILSGVSYGRYGYTLLDALRSLAHRVSKELTS